MASEAVVEFLVGRDTEGRSLLMMKGTASPEIIAPLLTYSPISPTISVFPETSSMELFEINDAISTEDLFFNGNHITNLFMLIKCAAKGMTSLISIGKAEIVIVCLWRICNCIKGNHSRI